MSEPAAITSSIPPKHFQTIGIMIPPHCATTKTVLVVCQYCFFGNRPLQLTYPSTSIVSFFKCLCPLLWLYLSKGDLILLWFCIHLVSLDCRIRFISFLIRLSDTFVSIGYYFFPFEITFCTQYIRYYRII